MAASHYQFATQQHYDPALVGQMALLAEHLDYHGLNLCSVLAPQQLEAADIAVSGVDSAVSTGVYVLVGNGGGRFWTTVRARHPDLQALLDQDDRDVVGDPVDHLSLSLAEAALQALFPQTDYRVLFPPQAGGSSAFLPLQQLGAIAGWHQHSPLGSGMHPDFGLWFAYRAMFWVAADPVVGQPSIPAAGQRGSPVNLAGETHTLSDQCLRCQTQDCVSACPAQAIDLKNNPDMSACAGYRLSGNSQCADRCLAREACPAGDTTERYPRDQTRYHYSLALHTLRRYYTK